MSIIFTLLFIVLILFIFASSVLFSVIRWVLSLFRIGGPRTTTTSSGSSTADAGYKRTNSSSGWHFSPEAEYKRKKKKKIISADEGEYVDFEDVKK